MHFATVQQGLNTSRLQNIFHRLAWVEFSNDKLTLMVLMNLDMDAFILSNLNLEFVVDSIDDLSGVLQDDELFKLLVALLFKRGFHINDNFACFFGDFFVMFVVSNDHFVYYRCVVFFVCGFLVCSHVVGLNCEITKT